MTFTDTPLRSRKIVFAIAALLVGVSPTFLVPALRLGLGPTIEKIIQDTGGHMMTFVSLNKIAEEYWKLPLYLGYQFPTLALLSGFIGFNELKKRDAGKMLHLPIQKIL